ncbi:MAG: hypothetical protein GEU91_01645 [Rhizobiales bacterium]|nr:hypothetical protein [Hyphomicrobiales bacterium]
MAITTILFCVTLGTAVILAHMPQPEPTEKRANTSEIVAAIPQTPTPQVQEAQAAQPEQTGDPSLGIRIVDLPSDMTSSCEESVWPYIDQRCLTKIGPRLTDAKPQSNPPANSQEQSVPIGSMTAIKPARPKVPGSMMAIVPARPKVSETDGVATREPEERVVETGPVEVAEPVARADRTPDAAQAPKFVRVDQVVERREADRPQRRASVVRKKRQRQVTQESKAYQPQRRASVVRKKRQRQVAQESKAYQPQRRASVVRKKRQRQVANVRRKTRIASSAPEVIQEPRFFFPFGRFGLRREMAGD